MPFVLEPIAAPTNDVRLLIGELDAELAGPYSPEQRHGLNIARIFQPNILFFVARLAGSPVGCAAVAMDDGFAEAKRMYVRPHVRRQGVARMILARLEQATRSRGISRLTLETGDAQLAAMRFYEREGFTRRAAFGAYASMPPESIVRSVFFEKRIG